MDLFDPTFIKRLLDMPRPERVTFYTGPEYKSLSPEDREKFDLAREAEQNPPPETSSST